MVAAIGFVESTEKPVWTSDFVQGMRQEHCEVNLLGFVAAVVVALVAAWTSFADDSG